MSLEQGKKGYYETIGEIVGRGVSNSAVLVALRENPDIAQSEVIERANTVLRNRLGEDRTEDEKKIKKAMEDLEKDGLIEEHQEGWDLTEKGEEILGFLYVEA